MPIKIKKQNVNRRIHRVLGLFSFVFLCVLTVTGILLMNPRWLGDDLTITTALEQSHGTWIGTASGLFYKGKNDKEMAIVPLRYVLSKVVGIIESPYLMVAFEDALLLEKRKNRWNRILIPVEIDELWALTSSKEGILLTTNNGVYVYQNETWVQQFQSSHSQKLYWVKKVHSGYIGADWVRSVFHMLSWVTMGLIITGLVLLFIKK